MHLTYKHSCSFICFYLFDIILSYMDTECIFFTAENVIRQCSETNNFFLLNIACGLQLHGNVL